MMAGGAAAAGVAHAEREEWSDAARCFSEALLEDAGNAEVHEMRAQCLNELGEHSAAVEAARQATTLKPDWVFGWLTRGRCERNAGDLASAVSSLREVLAVCRSVGGSGDGVVQEAAAELAEAESLLQKSLARPVQARGFEEASPLLRDDQKFEAVCETTDFHLHDGAQVGQLSLRIQEAFMAPPGCQHGRGAAQPSAAEGEIDSSLGPACKVWECGTMLARFIARAASAQDAAQVSGNGPAATPNVKRLPLRPGAKWLELGAGTGIVGLAAAVSGGCSVTLTDIPAALDLLTRNAEANAEAVAARGGAVRVAAYQWEAGDLPASVAEHQWDGVFASDCVYNPAAVPVFSRALHRVMAAAPNAVIVLAHKSRNPDVDAALLGALRACGILVEEEPFDEPDEAFRTKSVHLYVGKLGQRGP